MPKVTFNGLGRYFVVADGRLKISVPVDQTFASVDQTLREQIVKGPTHGAGAHRVERKTCSSPIAGTSKSLELT